MARVLPTIQKDRIATLQNQKKKNLHEGTLSIFKLEIESKNTTSGDGKL
jgi:hypothetical protein